MTRAQTFELLESLSITLESLIPGTTEYTLLAQEEQYYTDYILTGKQCIPMYTA